MTLAAEVLSLGVGRIRTVGIGVGFVQGGCLDPGKLDPGKTVLECDPLALSHCSADQRLGDNLSHAALEVVRERDVRRRVSLELSTTVLPVFRVWAYA